MRLLLTAGEDYDSPLFLCDDPLEPGRSDNNVVGRFVASTAFIDAAARFGTFDYSLCPMRVVNEQGWERLKERVPIPLVKPLQLPTILEGQRVILHELMRHKVGRLATLRGMYASAPMPVTAQLHGLGSNTLVEDLCTMLLTPLSQNDTIVCSSVASESAMQRALASAESVLRERGARVHVPATTRLPLGVDTDYFKPRDKRSARAMLGIDEDVLVFVTLGRLSPSDKADLLPLLESFATVHAQLAGTRRTCLVIAGSDKNDRSRRYVRLLEREIQRLGLTGAVTLLPNFPAEDRPSILGVADVFVALSDSVGESFGLTVVEALCSGIPVIAADWDGYRDHIAPERNGLLVPVHWVAETSHLDLVTLVTNRLNSDIATGQSVVIDQPALTDAMARFASFSPGRRAAMSTECARAATRYSWRTIIDRYEGMWRALGEGPKPQAIQAAPITRRGEIFRAYPSSQIGNETVVKLSGHPRYTTLGHGQPAPPYEELLLAGYSPELAAQIEAVLSNGPTRLDVLTASLSTYRPSTVIWHALLLVKHGRLSFDTADRERARIPKHDTSHPKPAKPRKVMA